MVEVLRANAIWQTWHHPIYILIVLILCSRIAYLAHWFQNIHPLIQRFRLTLAVGSYLWSIKAHVAWITGPEWMIWLFNSNVKIQTRLHVQGHNPRPFRKLLVRDTNNCKTKQVSALASKSNATIDLSFLSIIIKQSISWNEKKRQNATCIRNKIASFIKKSQTSIKRMVT